MDVNSKTLHSKAWKVNYGFVLVRDLDVYVSLMDSFVGQYTQEHPTGRGMSVYKPTFVDEEVIEALMEQLELD